jgi:hypothetical protein
VQCTPHSPNQSASRGDRDRPSREAPRRKTRESQTLPPAGQRSCHLSRLRSRQGKREAITGYPIEHPGQLVHPGCSPRTLIISQARHTIAGPPTEPPTRRIHLHLITLFSQTRSAPSHPLRVRPILPASASCSRRCHSHPILSIPFERGFHHFPPPLWDVGSSGQSRHAGMCASER